MTNEEMVISLLKKHTNLCDSAIYGICANIHCESGFKPNVIGDNGTSYGLCQWHKGRWENLKKYCKKNNLDDTSIEGQVLYLIYELKKSYKSVWEVLSKCKNTKNDLYDSAYYFCKKFEIPKDTENTAIKRGNFAVNRYYSKLQKTNTSSNKETTTSTSTKKVDYAMKHDSTLSGQYIVTASSGLNLRYGASTEKEVIKVLKKGQMVTCYGYYTNDWLLVQVNGSKSTGFACKKYLKRV